jgi:pyrroloquinoline quinone biosynthesis protein D
VGVVNISNGMTLPPKPDDAASESEAAARSLVPRLVPGVETSRLGDEFVVLDGQGRMVRSLNPIGARVFELMDGVRTAEEISGAIASELSVPLDRARRDVLQLLSTLSEWNLVVYAPVA